MNKTESIETPTDTDTAFRTARDLDQLAATLDRESKELPTDPSALAEVVLQLESAKQSIDIVLKQWKSVLAEALSQVEGERLVLNGSLIEKTGSYSRTKIDHEGLQVAAKRWAMSEDNRLDKVTGEVRSVDATTLDVMDKCFSRTPRWGAIKAILDVYEDEFCEREWRTSVRIR